MGARMWMDVGVGLAGQDEAVQRRAYSAKQQLNKPTEKNEKKESLLEYTSTLALEARSLRACELASLLACFFLLALAAQEPTEKGAAAVGTDKRASTRQRQNLASCLLLAAVLLYCCSQSHDADFIPIFVHACVISSWPQEPVMMTEPYSVNMASHGTNMLGECHRTARRRNETIPRTMAMVSTWNMLSGKTITPHTPPPSMGPRTSATSVHFYRLAWSSVVGSAAVSAGPLIMSIIAVAL
ncbi:hypothetical protein HYFRA_00005706 [Hymenoscyphus fraxineus]|uniref:Uncharacterized protein n=1 Tax=Hymenoscyphus fraxineus TaxID=746836 RepID=A0A9N9KTU9_9HELO|nr:hypothetical protein HYFRA_00005706 [Hymenoscyphus fraxineus]